jgi:hypothetical protein
VSMVSKGSWVATKKFLLEHTKVTIRFTEVF